MIHTKLEQGPKIKGFLPAGESSEQYQNRIKAACSQHFNLQ